MAGNKNKLNQIIMKLVVILSLIFSLASCNRVDAYQINGALPGAKDGVVVKLMNIENNPAVMLDSTTVKNGKFMIKGMQPFDYPKYCQLIVDMTPEIENQRQKTLKAYRFFADNSVMEFNCQADSMPSYYWEPVSKEHNVSLTGSPAQDLYNQYRQLVEKLSKQNSDLWNKYLEVYHRPAIDGAFNTKEGMQIVRERNVVKDKINKEKLKFIKENNNSVVALHLASGLLLSTKASMTLDEIDELINGFDPSLQQSDLMKALKNTAEEVRCVAKGIKYHDIELTDLKGKKVMLSEYVKPGEYNMLEFWASWCGPCRGEIPHLRHLYQSGGKKHLNMISISIDERDADWKKAVKEEHMEWNQLCDQNGRKGPVTNVYHVNGVPYCLILDPDGKIVCGGVRGAELDVVVTDLFGDKISGL